MKTYPSTSVLDLFRLLGGFVSAFLRTPRQFDIGQVMTNWMRNLIERYGSENLILNLLFKKILLVSERDLSKHILKDAPTSLGYVEGALKKNSMAFLAPHALTISHDEQWKYLREYNERVLCTGLQHHYQQTFLNQVHRAFSKPVANIADIRQCMGEAMLGIVFGENIAPPHLIQDIQVLFGLVENPLKRLIWGSFQKKRREEFYGTLRQLWEKSEASKQPSLLSMGHHAKSGVDAEEFIQQIPHWMFTFTGSGTDLLVRTLTLITSRPFVMERVQREISESGSLDQASTIAQLSYLEACLLEPGRLYPPVPTTFHLTPLGDVFEDNCVPAGMEILHFFPLMQRHQGQDPDADRFQPERRLEFTDQEDSVKSNLFLSGSRACPGKDLILFVCKSAIALLLTQQKLKLDSALLAQDPLPISFPQQTIHVSAQ